MTAPNKIFVQLVAREESTKIIEIILSISRESQIMRHQNFLISFNFCNMHMNSLGIIEMKNRVYVVSTEFLASLE